MDHSNNNVVHIFKIIVACIEFLWIPFSALETAFCKPHLFAPPRSVTGCSLSCGSAVRLTSCDMGRGEDTTTLT